MSVILKSLNAHNLPILQPILMILVSKFMVCRALSDKTYLLLGLLSPLMPFNAKDHVGRALYRFFATRLLNSIYRSMNIRVFLSYEVKISLNAHFVHEKLRVKSFVIIYVTLLLYNFTKYVNH